ncbi:MAG: hypothetical protein BWK75_06235 [Candidatus Altiarchaeales archaeon A3]|nr:MAG: hypothetical protein BWK75_06235 [Candidatus Altiarchaeales archaeon A3]
MKYNLFVSGVQKELEIERRVVKDLVIENPLLKDYFNIFLFEDLSAKGKSSKKRILMKSVKVIFIYVF